MKNNTNFYDKNVISTELQRFFPEVEPMVFYREIFPEGELAAWQEHPEEEQGTGEHSYVGIAVRIPYDKGKQGRIEKNIVTDDLDTIKDFVWRDDRVFTVIAPISYAGKSRKSENARFMYALCVEIDGLIVGKKGTQDGLHMLYHLMGRDVVPMVAKTVQKPYFPMPTYTVASGNGIHLYYVFERPIPCFKNVMTSMKKYKKRLTKMLWNRHITTLYQPQDIQYESIFQAFRMVGTTTKNNSIVRAYETGEKVSLEYMNIFVADKDKIAVAYKKDLPLAKAKELYPEWYQRRVVEQAPKGRWVCKRDLYDWWLNRLQNEVTIGHRYYGLMCLSIYAVKCNISEEELQHDCIALMPAMQDMDEPQNRFTEHDVLSALQAYQDGVVTTPISYIETVSGLPIERNKRNHRPQPEHLKIARFIRDMAHENWDAGAGRPVGRSEQRDAITAWRKEHPTGRKCDCIRTLGYDKKTVYRWWDNPTPDKTDSSAEEWIF